MLLGSDIAGQLMDNGGGRSPRSKLYDAMARRGVGFTASQAFWVVHAAFRSGARATFDLYEMSRSLRSTIKRIGRYGTYRCRILDRNLGCSGEHGAQQRLHKACTWKTRGTRHA